MNALACSYRISIAALIRFTLSVRKLSTRDHVLGVGPVKVDGSGVQ